LQDGSRILGQSEISHPRATTISSNINETISSPLVVNKQVKDKLSTPINYVFYLNEYFQEIQPEVNPNVIHKIIELENIVYGIGSLYTSIIPCLILKGIGETIANLKKSKILMLNSETDRETFDMTAIDIIYAITTALNRRKNNFLPKDYITHIFIPKNCNFQIDHIKIQGLGINIIDIQSYKSDNGFISYDEEHLLTSLYSILV